jgi:CRISPR-associated protein Cas5t
VQDDCRPCCSAFRQFRKSYARSYAETYSLPPPATIYGMLLSLVGEKFRRRHEYVKLAFAYRGLPRIATTLRKLSRYKYGVASKQSSLGNTLDYIETLCDLEFICWIDSSDEAKDKTRPDLEQRVAQSLGSPQSVNRFGILALGLSDDAVNSISLCSQVSGDWLRLMPSDNGPIELPVWVDHVGAAGTRWQRYDIDITAQKLVAGPEGNWAWTQICAGFAP